MPWYRVPATIVMEIEAKDEQACRDKANTILSKRVEGQEFGHEKNDRGSVLYGESELTDGWEVLHSTDTELCDACGARAALGEERPDNECECECHDEEE